MQEATEDVVKAHFSRWGIVTDVYFPRHKKTLKRRPFCFITFASRESAERALSETPLNICGIPIKNVTMVEDRDKYYKEKHEAAQQALMAALTSLGAAGCVGPEQVENIAAVLAMEGVNSDAILSLLLQQQQQQQQPGVSYGAIPAYPFPQAAFGPAPPRLPRYTAANSSGEPVGATMAMRAGSGPLSASIPAGAPMYPSMMSRDSSHSSLSDWYSVSSSARNSLDWSGPPLFPATTQSLGAGRLSVDAALQLRQQLLNATAWLPPGIVAPPGLQNSTNSMHSGLYQCATAPQAQASVMQSGLYQPSAALPTSTSFGAMSPSPLPLRPIQEGVPIEGYGTDPSSSLWAQRGGIQPPTPLPTLSDSRRPNEGLDAGQSWVPMPSAPSTGQTSSKPLTSRVAGSPDASRRSV